MAELEEENQRLQVQALERDGFGRDRDRAKLGEKQIGTRRS